MRLRAALTLTVALAAALLCAALAGYGSAIAIAVAPAPSGSLSAGALPQPGIFDDGVIQNSDTYSPLDYGVSGAGAEVAAVTGTGSVTVFGEPGGGWGAGAPAQSVVTVPSSAVNSWGYGQETYTALAPDGNTLYVEFTGIANSGESVLPPGFIYVYTHSASSWTLTDTLSAASGFAFASTGLVLSGDGSTIVAGGIQTTGSSGAGSPGEPYDDLLVFQQAAGSWSGVSTEATETPSFSIGDAPWEWSVSADGATIAVETYDGFGSSDEDDIVYTQDGASQISLAASGPAAISGDGSTIVVSEPGGGGGAGFADVFERPGAAWTSSGALAAGARLSDTAAGVFGNALTVNSNGSAVFVTVDPSAAESGLSRSSFNGSGVDTFTKPGGGWTTTTAADHTWIPTTYPSTATADSVNSLVLSADDSALVSLGADCASASSSNGEHCSPGMFVFDSASGGGPVTTSTTTSTTSSTPTQTAPSPTTPTATGTATGTQTSTTPQSTCPQSASPSTNCGTGLGQSQTDGNTLNMPASCNYSTNADNGASCAYNSGAYQLSSAACQSGCSITPSQAEAAAGQAVQSFMNSIGAGSPGQSGSIRDFAVGLRLRPALEPSKKKGKPYRITRVASGRLSVPAGKTKTLTLKLNGAATAQLRRQHQLKLLVLVARTFAGHTTLELKREIVFKLAKPKRKRR
jgi:hypothetical protein